MNLKKTVSVLIAGACVFSMMGFSPVLAKADGVTYRLGDQGDNVKKIQEQLTRKGYYFSDCTGYFGDITRTALTQFQKYNDLDQDGIAGEDTLKLLFGSSYKDFVNDASADSASDSSDYKVVNGHTYSKDTLLIGDESSQVTDLQAKLKKLGYYTFGKNTGYFGPITAAAVEKFQDANGLSSDGIVGPNTKGKLNSSKAVSASSAKKSAPAPTKTASSAPKSTASKNTASTAPKNTASKPASSSSSSSSLASQIIATAKKYLGRPYVYGANGPDAFDCTGFTTYVFRQYGISLPRTAYDQGYSNYGTKISSIAALQPGDLVFFNTISDSDLSDHAGIYIGGGQFIQAGSGSARCVKISSLTSGYYLEHFSWGRRVL